jgi:4'-phosphopantetheinyl transferase
MFSLYIENIKDFDYLEARKNLSNNILLRCDRYKIEEKRKQSVIGYYLLKKYLLEDYNITLNNILENEYGKPYINDIYFNISHSANMIAIIISDTPCGVDIQVEDQKNLKLAKKILNTDELAMIEKFDDDLKLEYIMKKWVSLEAYNKMLGSNLNLKLNVEVEAVKVNHIYEDKTYYLAKFIEK